MTLRRRLALAYGAMLALVLVPALTIAYVLHAEAHDSDVDSALYDLATSAQTQIDDQLHSGVPLASIDITGLKQGIDEPYAVWLFADDRQIASGGFVSDAAFVDVGPAALTEGWNTYYTVDGRVRSYVVPLGIGRVVVAANLSAIDKANSDLRFMFVLLGIFGIAFGTAFASTVAGYLLRPVATLTETAAGIAESRDFTRRVPVKKEPEDELDVLAITFDEMLTSLDDAYRQQQRFLGDVSHELRTPLTTIRGHAELLAAENVTPEERREGMAHIARESARLARLVNELLVLARAEAAESFVPRAVDLDEVVMETFEEMRPLAEGRLRVRWIERTRVNGERDRLKQLVLALVDNALRYTAVPGHVDVSLADDGRDAVLRVEDEGIGIDDADLPRVFDRFYRGAAARRVNGSGSGLGLAIVRWIVQRHSGSIRLEKREGGGTIVTVRVPLAAPSAPERGPARVDALAPLPSH